MAFFQCTPAYVSLCTLHKSCLGRTGILLSTKSHWPHPSLSIILATFSLPQQAQGSCAWPRLTRLWFPLYDRHVIPATTQRLSVRETSRVTATKGLRMAREGLAMTREVLGHPRTPTATKQTRRLRT
jgi:hypothetical protein